MEGSRTSLDATGAVSVSDAGAVAAATRAILERRFGATFDARLLHESFGAIERLFAGGRDGYLACDMPYHDLRHSLDTALVMARLIGGCPSANPSLTPELGLCGVLLGLMHDTGLIRKDSEAALCGPQLMAEHESRSVAFAAAYLRTTSLAHRAELAPLIMATCLGADLDALFAGYDAAGVIVGRMLGTADLVSQVADPVYLERCYYHLYPELVLGGRDRVKTPDGREQLLYEDAFDLVRHTPGFYEKIVERRLTHDFDHVDDYLRVPLQGSDVYGEAIRRNVDRAARIAAEGRSGLPGQVPATTTRDLAAIYAGRAPGAATAD